MERKWNLIQALALLMTAISLLTAVPMVGTAETADESPASFPAVPDVPIKLVGFDDKSVNVEKLLASLTASSERIDPDRLSSAVGDNDLLFINAAGLELDTSIQAAMMNDNQSSFAPGTEYKIQDDLCELLLRGVPVLILADDPGLFQAALTGLSMPMVFQDGSSIYGYKYDPALDAAAGFCVGRPNPTLQPDEVQAAYAWGAERLNGLSDILTAQEPERSQAAAVLTTPWWQGVYTLSSYNNYGSYGRLNVNTAYYTLMNDGDNTYNYYVVNFGLQNMPGTSGLGQWYNADMWVNTGNINDRGDIHPTRWLLNNQPTSTVSGGTLTVSFSQYGAPVTWSYPINDVTAHDQSNYGTGTAAWWHDVNEAASIGRQSYTIHPGMLVRTQQAWGGYYQVMHDTYKIQWYQMYIWPFGGWHTEQVVLQGQVPAPTS